jgi:predicted DNA-binding transcriptional regulator AlpA
MSTLLRCCNDTYARGHDAVWRYDWGEPVPGAQDLTLGLARRLALVDAPPATPLEDAGVVRLLESFGLSEPWMADPGDPDTAVLGLLAPELTASAMLTVADVGQLAGVSKATIDSYRYRGYLPEPQFVKVRTPLWTRPVIRHWLQQRPGCGWRTDIYGERSSATVERRMPITRARRARAGQPTG